MNISYLTKENVDKFVKQYHINSKVVDFETINGELISVTTCRNLDAYRLEKEYFYFMFEDDCENKRLVAKYMDPVGKTHDISKSANLWFEMYLSKEDEPCA